jgi:hypothetical protein
MADQKKRWKENSALYVSTLVYLDEPQIVLLDHGDDAKIIGVAIEKEGYEYPFLGAEVSFSQWERYRRQFVDLRYLFLVPKWRRWFLFDLADLGEDKKIPLERAKQEDYRNNKFLPSHGFFSRDHTEPEPSFGETKLGIQKFSIDGNWEPADLSIFFGRINDLYSFFLGLSKFASTSTTQTQKRALVEAFTENTLHSGFNYVNFYGDLKGLLGFDERLAMGSIVKQSPGFVDVEGKEDTLKELGGAFENYVNNQESLKAKYNELHGYMSKANLLKKAGAERLEATDAVSKFIKEKNEAFSAELGVDLKTIDRLTSRHVVSTAKILLSYHRRLERYHVFFVEGRVKIRNPVAPLVANSPSIDGTLDA